MDELAKRNCEITNILSLITGISRQTNLLSLDASMEAQEQGNMVKGLAIKMQDLTKKFKV